MSAQDSKSEAWPLGSEEELQWRLSLVVPTDTTRGLFLKSVLESVRKLGNEAAVQRCLEASGEQRFVDLFNYPISAMLRMTYVGARLLTNETRSFDEVLRQMGYLSTNNFTASTVGALMLKMVLGKPRLLLDTLPASHRINTSAGECKVRWTGPRSAVVLITRDYLPSPYTEGSLQGAFAAAKVRGLTVRSRPSPSLDNEYELSWD
jgi:uncharacterized protein (TIGR02265 family)